MSEEQITLRDQYVVTGISTERNSYKSGKRVYAATDAHSGGYPWWADDIKSAGALKSDIDVIVDKHREATSGYMADQAQDIQIAVVRTTLTFGEVTTELIDEKRREKALKKLTDDERRALGL